MSNSIPCNNPAHGVTNHIIGTSAAVECQNGRSNTKAARGAIPSVIPSASQNRAPGHTIQDSVNEIGRVAAGEIATRFLGTDIGDQFDEDSLSIAEDGESFSLKVEESFTMQHKRHNRGDVVRINKNLDFIE